MSKQIHFADDARQKMFAGIEKVKNTVAATMGPKGRNVIFSKGYGAPTVTNDGVTIAREIELEDKLEAMGADLVKEAASNTNKVAGDGTTTATLLTWALVKEGLREIRSGINAVELKNGMNKAGSMVVGFIHEHSEQVNTKEKIEQVATISAQDSRVGKIIAEAMEKVGQDGVITVEEGQTFGLEVDITEGMQLDTGYISPYMVSDPEKMEARIDDAAILLTDQKISNLQDLLPLLEELASTGKRDIVIIAEDVESEALTGIILNKLKGALNILAIKTPGFGDNKKANIKDIAVLTGATPIIEELGNKLSDAGLHNLGRARSVIATKANTTIIGGEGEKTALQNRIAEIRNEIDTEESDYTKNSLKERLARLAGGIAVIKVGAASEVEMKEKKLRIEDALNSTQAAVEEGVVAGGGTILAKASKLIEENFTSTSSEDIGASIVGRALKYPIKTIAENAGKEGEVIVDKIINKQDINYGYDASSDKYVDMLAEGIIDPAKVERAAIENAISIAGMFLTTEAVISDIEDKNNETPNIPAMPGMGGMGGMPMM